MTPVETGKSVAPPDWRDSVMRHALSILAVLLVAAIFAPAARAQASLPYRRTIEYLPDRPREFTGRYVRVNVSFAGNQPTSTFGRTNTSIGVQATINPGVGGPDLAGGNSSASGGGNALGGAGGPGPGAGKTVFRGP